MRLATPLRHTIAAASVLVASAAQAQTCAPAQEAQYRVVFDAVWSATTHPQDFPAANPHFSGMVGGTHNGDVAFWATGELASNGIQQMAERGRKDPLIEEVDAAISAGTAFGVVSGGGIGFSPGSNSTTFAASLEHSLATIVSMIAPSPDWFVGVAGIELFVDNDWVDGLAVELYPYDAGTDSGATFITPNDPTVPPEPIFQINGYPFLNGATVLPLATFTFELLDTVCVDSDADGVSDAADNCLHVANENQLDSNGDGLGNACDADLDNNCQVDFQDLGQFKSVIFQADADADFNGDGTVNFIDLGTMKAQFFADFNTENPSGIPNDCGSF